MCHHVRAARVKSVLHGPNAVAVVRAVRVLPARTRATFGAREDADARRALASMARGSVSFCFRQPAGVEGATSFVAIDAIKDHKHRNDTWYDPSRTLMNVGRRYVASPGAADFMLEHESAVPDAAEFRALRVDSVAEDLQRRFRELSTRTNVSTGQATILLSAFEFGVGATVSSLAMVLLDALGRDQTIFAPPLRFWTQPQACERADMSCFFDSLPSLSALRKDVSAAHSDDSRARNWRLVLRGLSGNGEQVSSITRTCREHRVACPRLLKRTAALKLNESNVLRRLPKRWVERGRFWLVSQALYFLTRPNQELRRALDDTRASLRIPPGPVLGVQVRKGDACTARGECRGLKDWLPQVRSMANAYGFRTAFLSTPSADVQAEADLAPESLQWHYVRGSAQTARNLLAHRVTRIEDALRRPGVFSPMVEWRRYMVDIYLLAEADAIVGTFSSNAVRLAYSLLSVAKHGCLQPFASDMNWCWAFGRGGPEVTRVGRWPKEGVGSC